VVVLFVFGLLVMIDSWCVNVVWIVVVCLGVGISFLVFMLFGFVVYFVGVVVSSVFMCLVSLVLSDVVVVW